MFRINVGSKNPAKVEAVREVLESYDFLKPFEMNYFDVFSGVREQPIGFDEIVLGSRNRAKNSFLNCDYSIGLESGIFLLPHSGSSYFDVCSCAIYDGKDFYLGISEAFEIPKKLSDLIRDENFDLSRATRKAGLTSSEKIGNEKGIINILSGGRFTRGEQIKKSLQTALMRLENPRYYK
ncbi:DUF84 family protein [Candidatus Pacearchaeota archaeon]|nr:DUF84 family protein [Candidatus Pacearchaeota archaeon]